MVALFICSFVSLVIGALLGVYDCKKTYGIPKGIKPEEGRFVLDADLVEDYDDGHFEY